MGKMYLLSRIGWEYDDNFYFKDGSKDPIEIYTIFEIAELALKNAEIARARKELAESSGSFISNYTYNYDKPILTRSFKRKCKEEYNISFHRDDPCPFTEGYKSLMDAVSPSTPDEFYIEFLEICKVNFYEIIEIEVIA